MTHDLDYSFDKPIPAEAVERLLKQTEWGADRPRNNIQTMIDGSLCLSVWQNATLVGFARAVTDGVYRAFIEDVVIDEALRGQGIGSEMMRRFNDKLAHIELVMLGCGEERIPFYERLGFARVAMPIMQIWRGD